MSTVDRATGPRKRIGKGLCHRCGWRGYVTKVRRHDRKLLGIDRAYGRLCQECVGALFAGQLRREGITPISEQVDRESATKASPSRRLRGR